MFSFYFILFFNDHTLVIGELGDALRGPGPTDLAGVDKLVVRRPGSRLGAQAPPAPPPGPPCPRGLQAGPATPQPPWAGPAGPRAAHQYRHVAQRRPQHAAHPDVLILNSLLMIAPGLTLQKTTS